jgi:hypothetical protein
VDTTPEVKHAMALAVCRGTWLRDEEAKLAIVAAALDRNKALGETPAGTRRSLSRIGAPARKTSPSRPSRVAGLLPWSQRRVDDDLKRCHEQRQPRTGQNLDGAGHSATIAAGNQGGNGGRRDHT